MAAIDLVTAEIEMLVEDLEQILGTVLDRRRDVPIGIREHLCTEIANLIDAAKAGAASPRIFSKRFAELELEVAAEQNGALMRMLKRLALLKLALWLLKFGLAIGALKRVEKETP